MFFHAFILAMLAATTLAEEPSRALLAGDPLPDAAFVNAQGKAWRWSELRGKPFAFTFLFTRCPLPEFCPRLLANFAAAERALEAAPIASGWRLVCLTLDPAFDTPKVLAAYAAPHRPDPEHWIFATGEPEALDRLGTSLGLTVARTGELPVHNLRTVVVGSDGRIRKIFTGNEWRAEELVEELRRAAP